MCIQTLQGPLREVCLLMAAYSMDDVVGQMAFNGNTAECL